MKTLLIAMLAICMNFAVSGVLSAAETETEPAKKECCAKDGDAKKCCDKEAKKCCGGKEGCKGKDCDQM